MSAAERWKAGLSAWALPEALLASADESPYGWPQELWKRRSQSEMTAAAPTPTATVVGRLLGLHGTLLDVGAGRGRASLPFAASGHRLVAVEPDADMARGLVEDAHSLGAAVELIPERWPDAADRLGPVDVALSAHVVYDVSDLTEFLSALHEVATVGVVLEMSDVHPWADLAPLYRAVHELDRPDGPSTEDLIDVVREELGVVPEVIRWERPGQLWFADWVELCDFYGRRLVMSKAKRHELKPLLEPVVVEEDGRLTVGVDQRRLSTVWWRKPAS